MVIKQLVEKLVDGPPGIPSGLQPKPKRKRNEETVWIRQLMCIPSISERIARLLLKHFVNLRALQEAPAGNPRGCGTESLRHPGIGGIWSNR